MQADETITEAEILDSSTNMLDALKLRLAAQVAPRRWSRALRRVVATIEQGTPLDMALKSEAKRIPGDLRCLMESALAVADPAELILEAARTRQSAPRNGRILLSSVVYPFILWCLAIAISSMYSYAAQDFESMLEEFGIDIPLSLTVFLEEQRSVTFGSGLLTLWIVITVVTIVLIGPRWAWLSIGGGLVFIGRPLRWMALQELLSRYRAFAAQGVVDGAIAQAVSHSFQRSGQSQVAGLIESRIAQGAPLGQAISETLLGDGLCKPALVLLDHQNRPLPAAIAETTDMLAQLVEQRCRILASLLPLLVLLLVATMVWNILANYLSICWGLISMITSLA